MDSSKDVIVNIMLEFVRAAVLERDPIIPHNTVIDWDELMDMSFEQGLLSWVWDGICKLPMESQPFRQQRINWGLSAQEIWNTYNYQKSVLKEMVVLCEREGMRLLVFKGFSLSSMYNKPRNRAAGDIDIFLFGDYSNGNVILANNRLNRETSKCSEFYFKGVKIENHKHFFPSLYKKYIVIDEYVSSKISEAEKTVDGYYVFSNLMNLVICVVHAVTHLANTRDPLKLRSILDIAVILNNDSKFTPSQCKAVMTQLGINKSFDLLVRMSEWILNIDLARYYTGNVPTSDVESFKNLLIKRKWPIIIESGSKWKQFCQNRERYRMLQWADSYLVCTKNEKMKQQLNKQLRILNSIFK